MTTDPLGGAREMLVEQKSPHIEAVKYARAYAVPLYRADEEGTPYERGLVRQIAQHYLAGYFAARDGILGQHDDQCEAEAPILPLTGYTSCGCANRASPAGAGTQEPRGAAEAEAERLLAKITPGEWEVAPHSDTDEVLNVVAGYEKVEGGARANWIAECDAAIDFDSDREGVLEQNATNAEFIAAAPRLLRALLSQLAAAQAREQALRELLERITGWDQMDDSADGPYWRREIAAVLKEGQ